VAKPSPVLNVREHAAVVETGEQSLNEALFELGQHGWISFPNGAPQRQ
jgi:hypothetical protein